MSCGQEITQEGLERVREPAHRGPWSVSDQAFRQPPTGLCSRYLHGHQLAATRELHGRLFPGSLVWNEPHNRLEVLL